MIKNFIDINNFNKKQIDEIINLAKKIKKNPKRFSTYCKGKTLGLIFEKPSTRTRVSFEIAMYQLGGNVTSLEHEKPHLGRGETISVTANVLSRNIDSSKKGV